MSSTTRGSNTWKVIFLARPRSFTVRVPALRKRPSLSQRCLSVVELVRISWIQEGSQQGFDVFEHVGNN